MFNLINHRKMKENLSKEDAELIKQDLVISHQQFNEYLNVQYTGLFNMLDPKARSYTSLSKDEWYYIIKNYDYLWNLYGNN
jgi:retron-type reverse transcriptase